MGTIFVFITIVLALHHQQSSTRSSLVHSEADLRFREAKNFAVREHLLDESSPWGLKVGADLEDITPEGVHPIQENYGRLLFEKIDGKWSGLPDLLAEDFAHAHRYLELKPTGFGGLASGLKKGSYKMVETEIPGYAAYAPNGNIRTGQVLGWQNPTYEESTGSMDAYSGVPAILGAQGDISVEEMAYGEAHSRAGNVSIEDGAGVGFVGNLPLPAYENDLMTQLGDADMMLTASTVSGNKTGLFSNHMGIGDMLNIAFGGDFNPETMLSLRQAFHFQTPMIPGGTMVIPGLVWEIWLHVPFQPDLGFSSQHDPDMSRLTEIGQEQTEAGRLLEQARQELEAARSARDFAQGAYSASPTRANQDALEDAQDDYEEALDKFEDIQDFLEDSAEEAGDIADEKLGAGSSRLPQTRDEDPSGRDGQWGWNYSKTMAKMVDLVTSIAGGGNLKDIAGSISSDVRVVHYGPADEVPGFDWDGTNFISRSTWTVPPSRTLRYDGSMEIRGDLWLQRGTVMTVNGNLKVVSPVATPSLTDAFAPSGRVFFEEGSTLIVTGDFSCQGSSHNGSIMVAGEPGEIHPITSALLVDGEVRIPNGIYAAHTLSDLIRAVGLPGTDGAADSVTSLMEDQAPLLSKLAGPFHLRNPYFAKYATTFQLVTIPFPPVIIVTPVPSMKENLHVFAFRAESFAFTAGLNASIGDNLYTQSDWWPFGNGVVPMALNLDLGAAAVAAGRSRTLLDSAELDPESIEAEVRDFVETLEERALPWAINEVLQKLTNEGARIVAGAIGFGPIMDTVNGIVREFQNDEDALDDFYQEFVRSFETRMGDAGRTLLADLLVNTNVMDADEYLKEYAGLLVHGRNIVVGPDARQVSGMFVAEEDINIQARLTVGTLMARNGSIQVDDFLYYPYFNQASLYVPSVVPGDTVLDRAMFESYGAAHNSGMAVQVGPPPVTHHMTSEGWER